MDWAEILQSCDDPAEGAAVLDSLNRLFSIDKQLLPINASDRAIAAKIAQYLQPHFRDNHIDVEYNCMGNAPEKVAWSQKPDEVFPDIIVHVRETETNVLAI